MERCRRCGLEPEAFKPNGGGSGIRCEGCGTQYSHPTFTEEQMERIWDYRNSSSFEEDD